MIATARTPGAAPGMPARDEAAPSPLGALRADYPDYPDYPVTIRVTAPTDPLLLPRLAGVAGAAGPVTGMDLVDMAPGGTTVDISLDVAGDASIERARNLLEGAGCRIHRVSDPTFLSHHGGKIEVTGKVAVDSRQALSRAYTPGVARVAAAIAEEPGRAWSLTAKGNSVAVVTDGSAVLGLGRLGPLAALPVMEGKALIFKEFAGVDAYPLCLDVGSSDSLVDAVAAIAPGFGGINLEDIAAPECFDIEREVQRRVDVPVFHDDQHGTAAVVLAGLLNACRVTDRTLDTCRVVQVGCGAAGTAIAEALLGAGVGDLVVFDRHGVLHDGAEAYPHHARIAVRSNPHRLSTMRAALTGAEIFIGTARRGAVDPRLLSDMARRPIVFALANPEPEILASELAPGAILATGRSDLPNQVNNSLCFPGLFRGALDARATSITPGMRWAATQAIAGSVTPEQRQLGVVIPSMFHREVHERVASAVADAWCSAQPAGATAVNGAD